MAHPLLEIKKHINEKEIYERYKKCSNKVERSHWQIIWLMSRTKNPLKATEIEELTGFTSDWVRKIVRRYNAKGPEALGDRRKDNGNEMILSEAQKKELLYLFEGTARDGGLWTGPKVADWISEKLGRRVSSVSGWKYLKRLGLSLRLPRPLHQKAATALEQESFKKNSKKK